MKGSLPVTPRDDWFDHLARSVAGSMSRRDAVGFLAGTTVMAILGSWVRPGRAFGAGASEENDPGCDGARTFYRPDCPNKVPKLAPYKPAINGCGPQEGFNPVPQSPLYLASFTPACNSHDEGYGTCNRPKAVTDKKFLDDMIAICKKEYSGTGFFTAIGLVQCARNAETYYTAVSLLGDDPYKQGQSEGCDCCDGCPGGGSKCGVWPLPGEPADAVDSRICCPQGFICHKWSEAYGFKPGITKCGEMCMRPKDVQYIQVKECRES
jgi:hypothetical protein